MEVWLRGSGAEGKKWGIGGWERGINDTGERGQRLLHTEKGSRRTRFWGAVSAVCWVGLEGLRVDERPVPVLRSIVQTLAPSLGSECCWRLESLGLRV